MNKRVAVSGAGCCLGDHVCDKISFASVAFSEYLSKQRGDGGLTPGHLVFKEDFENFIGIPFHLALKRLTHEKSYDAINIGGPGIVPLIHASQMLYDLDRRFKFYGFEGKDADGKFLRC